MASIQGQQITEQPQQNQWQPSIDAKKTKRYTEIYRDNPQQFSEEQLEEIRQHAAYYNIPFYEGDFSIFEAIKQAGGGFLEGFTTLRVADAPDNEWEAVARNVGHLAGFVPGILSGPLKALGLMRAAKAASGIKSIPMLGADIITKKAKKIVSPIIKNSIGSRFKAADVASKFFMKEKAAHLVEGAFHLGAASSISSVWDGVDQMWESFKHGAVAGGVFRTIGNVIPGTKSGDKVIKGIAGSMFMGLPSTMRGATTPEQIYEYLAGAYFGSKELPWYKAKAMEGFKKFNKDAETDPKLEWERNPEKWDRIDDYPEIVQKHIKKLVVENYGTVERNLRIAHGLMKEFGITDKIPKEDLTTKGYDALNKVVKGQQKKTRYKAVDKLGVGASGGAPGSDAYWGKIGEKYGFPVIHFIPETVSDKGPMNRYYELVKRGDMKGIERGLSESELMEAGPAVEKANLTLKRDLSNIEIGGSKRRGYEFILRNWFQVRNANSVYAIGDLETKGDNAYRTVKKGTGWAVQMALDKGIQNVNVYDQVQRSWFKWDSAANRFKAVHGVPKLGSNPALVGHRNLKAEGKQAIKDVYEITFGKMKTGEKSPLPEAVDPKEVRQHHIKTIENINRLRGEIDSKKQDIADINSVIKSGKADKVRVKDLVANKNKLQKEVDNLYKEIVEDHQTLKPTQYVDIHTGETINDVDVGMKSQDFALMKKSEYFANTHLKDLWEGEEGLLSKRNKMLEAGQDAERIIRANVEKGNKDFKIDKVVEDMEKVFSTSEKPFKLSDTAKSHVRKWLRELNLGKQVIFVKTRGGQNIEFTNPERPTSASGMAIRQIEPPKLIEEVYEKEGGTLKKGVSPIVVLDSVSREKKNGMAIDVPLDKLTNHFTFTEKIFNKEEAQKKTDDVIGHIIRTLSEKHNLVPLGGQGDKGRIVFVKVHPKSRKKNEVDKIYLDLMKSLRKRTDKDNKKTDIDAEKQFRADRTEMKKRFGVSEESFKKMVTSNLMYDLSLNGYKYNQANIDKLMGPGFINSAIAFNKRHQIWMTNGYGGNKEFFKTAKDNMGNTILNDLSYRGNFNIRLIQDPETPEALKKKALLALSAQMPEHVDGAILVRDDVIRLVNKDAGSPELMTQNKSFIIDNTTQYVNGKEVNLGALLGKYMMHPAGEKASKEMFKQNVHMIAMTSATKQVGERATGDYHVAKDGALTFTGGQTYELNPESIKYNTSVVNDKHMTQKQIWVKQLFTNLHQYSYQPITKEIINDINHEIVNKAFSGNPQINKKLAEYKANPSSEKMDFLLRNLEEIGTSELIEVLKQPGLERFSERAMQQMLRIVEKDVEAQFMEGEITAKERAAALSNFADAVSPIDRLLKNVAIVGEEANAQGSTGYSAYLHKYVRDYRAAVLHNYFVKSVTRPKTDNSAVARIRPFDKWMQQEFSELNTNDNIFYLDGAYRNTEIKVPNRSKPITLGELWDLRKNPAYTNIAENVFNALVLRVPMDSLSGAHKLKFNGFTGRDGHGIMMHSRTMRAIGGADLDGDEAFIYFGGKNEDGTGFGMKQSWINAINANRGEYYNKSKTDIKDNKTGIIEHGLLKGMSYKELLTEAAEPDHPLKTRKSLYYSPMSRIKASQGAVEGRGMLGVAVSQGQIMKSAYSSLMEAPGKEDKFTFRIHKDGLYRATIIPKTSDKDHQYQRELTRAQIAFASDPLDEAGLKSAEHFFITMHDAYFQTSFEKWNPGTKKYVKTTLPNKIQASHLKGGLIGHFRNMNRAYFGRNYDEGRRFTMDEVNHLASDIRFLNESQKNTMLPKLVEKLEGLDWSDNLFNRVDRKNIEKTYKEIDEMVLDKDGKFGGWLKDAMGRASFRVVYNDQIEAVMNFELYDRNVRHNIANDSSIEGLRNFRRIVKNSMFGKEFDTKTARLAKLYNYNERIKILEQMHRQAEDFLSNDIATMSTLLNIKRILEAHRIHPKMIEKIHRQVERFKARSYLARKERRQLDYSSYMGTIKEIEGRAEMQKFEDIMDKIAGTNEFFKQARKEDLAGDTRSATYDQMELDKKIREYKNKLDNDGQRELFDHLFIGTLNRGDINKVKKYMDMLPQKKRSPFLRDLITKVIKDASRTTQSRLAINSEEISDSVIQNHFRTMNDMHVRMWEPTGNSEDIFNKASKKIEEVKPDEPVIVDELVQGAHKGEGYAGIKAGELTQADKKLITDIATTLKKYNRKIGNNIPDLNEMIRGITSKIDPSARGKDLNALHRQDFENIRRYLQDVESGTMWQRIWHSDKPELQKRYYAMFPETITREMMKHDIKWLKKKGWFITRTGEIKEGDVRRPTYFLNMLQDIVTKNNGMATGKAEEMAKEIEAEFNHLQELKDGNGLFKVAVSQMELGVKNDIEKLEEPNSIKKHFRLIYDNLRNDTEKEFNWSKIKDKDYVVLNDNAERKTATGFEIVNGSKDKNLTGIKTKIANKFKQYHKLIVGDKEAFARYKTGKYFDPKTRLQPKMNWEKFVMDMQKALERGDTIPMELGIDGMRHIMRSMMVDLGSPTQAKNYSSWIIKNTGQVPFERYWPHMFYDRGSAERSIKKALEFIRNDGTLSEEQRTKAIQRLALRQKTLTGEWEVQDTQDWDKVDVLDFRKGQEGIAAKKKIAQEQVRWTDMNPTFSSMFSRKGHIPGWSTDMNVMHSYVKNLSDTYYRQISHLMSRNVLDKAYKRMSKKFGSDLATRWDRFFKLYVQGAMGQPDVIPERWYEDPKMKLKGTPYAWWADNRVLDRVNKIRKSLGIRESELPKELKDFDYNDLRHWSNMEAKFELASLLAHPKTAVTNIFGGSMHTIQSVGPGALRKARSIKWLKRINPAWNSLQDVEDFVVSKGVVPEFMIHELGLGREVKGDIKGFIGSLTKKINSKDEIARKEIFTLGKKYGLMDSVVSKASKFMSVPERILRRDAFMAHYVRAWERFGGAITDPNHPFLIETAKKGVKATQFLYEAPQRPFFARTALGKVMSRFQLYAWNSVRFRNDVIRNAKLYGFQPGTEAYQRFVRTAQIDLFVLALGNMFLFSLFDNALPQPWSWFQDTSEWLFGDDKEREKAFFGAYPTAIAPLQIITPPLARFPVSGLMQWARDDYTKFTDYQMYTLLPFGRIIRDVAQPNNGLIDNPSRILEKFAGMPVRDVQKFATQRKKDIESGERYKQPKVGL